MSGVYNDVPCQEWVERSVQKNGDISSLESPIYSIDNYFVLVYNGARVIISLRDGVEWFGCSEMVISRRIYCLTSKTSYLIFSYLYRKRSA